MKILVGVDDSPCSSAALDFVCKTPWPANTKVYVVSATPVPVPASSEVYVPAAAANETLVEELTKAHQELVSRAEKRLRDAGFMTEARVLMGDPREVIVQTVKDYAVDLAVVGSHGRSGMAKLLMGSVASHVVTHAPCNVLVVKKDRTEP